MDKNKLRKFLFMQDKQSGLPSPGQSVPLNKSAPKSMSPGLPKPMGAQNMSLPNPTAAPSIVGQAPKLPKMPKFGKTKSYFKK